MKNALNLPVLQLNKSWLPIHVTTVRDALMDLCNGSCRALDTENYTLYNWEQWIELPFEDKSFVQSVRFRVCVPDIVVLSEYNQVPRFEVKLNMKNIWLRDGGRCQYSGRHLSLRDATKDHILPESRGGGTVWNNIVTCCPNVNRKKGNKTPEEAGLNLLSVPRKPQWTPLFSAARSFKSHPESWETFLPGLKKHRESMEASSHANR
jgi:5-methylcytosine-specific restriction endonuclease McrA